jgi:O-antigen/teichoic acid export membrane protein
MPDLRAGAGMAVTEAPDTEAIRAPGSLFSNSVAMGVANLLSRGIGYVYIILMARRLDARYIGAYAILVTTALLVDLVSNLGLDKILIREIASRSEAAGKGYFAAALPIRFTMALLSAASAWVLLIMLFKDMLPANPLRIAIFLTAIFPVVAARNCEAFLTAHERLLPIAVSQFSERIVILAGVLLLCSGVIGFDSLLCFAPLAALARLLIVAWSTLQIWTPTVAPEHPNARQLIREGFELFSVEILALVYFRSDVFLLAKMDGLRETGVYQISYKIFDCCLSLFTGFLQAAFPRLVRDKSHRSLKAMLAGGVALLAIPVVIIILGRQMILGAIKPEYVKGSTSLIWLMLTIPLVYITSTLANVAIAAGQIKILMAMAGLLLITNIGLNLILIPKWSINGAAFSTFACELLSAGVLGPFVLKSLASSCGTTKWRT